MTQERRGITLEPQAGKSRSYLRTHLYTTPPTPPRKLKPVNSPVMEYHEVLRFHIHLAAKHSTRNGSFVIAGFTTGSFVEKTHFKCPQNNNFWNACDTCMRWREMQLQSLKNKPFSDLYWLCSGWGIKAFHFDSFVVFTAVNETTPDFRPRHCQSHNPLRSARP